MKTKEQLFCIFFILVISNSIGYNSFTVSNEQHTLTHSIKKDSVKNVTAQSSKKTMSNLESNLVFQILSPENNKTYHIRYKKTPYENPQPLKMVYYLSISEANVTFWLNGTILTNTGNYSDLPIIYRGYYNLTGVASFNGETIISTVTFLGLPPMEILFEYKELPFQDFPLYQVFSPNETVSVFITPREKNITLEISCYAPIFGVEEDLYPYFPITSSNYTWWNDTTILLQVEPLVDFYEHTDPILEEYRAYVPLDGFSETRINVTTFSNLEEGIIGKDVVSVSRDYYAPYIYLQDSQDFFTEKQSGAVTLNFRILDASPLIEDSFELYINDIYHSGKESISAKDPMNLFFKIETEINTLDYEDGYNDLTIIISDYHNHTRVLTVEFYIENEVPTIPQPTSTNSQGSSFLILLVFTGMLQFYKRLRIKKSLP